MMEAIGQNSATESTLDAAQNLKNDETNFQLNIVENSPNDDGDKDDDDDDDQVVEVTEEANIKATTNTQNVEVEYEDEDKMSQTSNNEPNKSIVECYKDDQLEIKVDKNIQRSPEDRYITQKMEDENSDQKLLNENQFNNKCIEITTTLKEDENVKEQKVEEEEEQKKQEIDAEAEAVVELKAADEPRTINEVEDIEVEISEQNKDPPPPQIIDVSQVSEDELLKSDDDDEIVKDAKEQSTKFLEDKENSDHALRIEIEDSLDSCNNDSKENAGVVINEAETEAKPTQDLHQTILIGDDNTSNNETIDVDNRTRVDDDKDVVTISDEESQSSMQAEENQKQLSSAMDVDDDIVETVKKDHRDDVINLDDETQDGINTDTNIAQQEQSNQLECITINEESQDLTIEQKEQENNQNEDSKNAMDINENGPHSDEEMQQTSAQQDEEKLNGIDENSNEGLRIDIADEDDDVDNTQQPESEQKLQISTHTTASANEEQNHAATTNMDYFAAENSDDSDNLITSIKRQFLRNENSSILPKLNGEYKNSETDVTQTVIHMQADAQAIEPTPIENDDDNNDYSSNLKIVDEHSKDSFSKENSQHSDEASKSPHGQHMLPNESDDEASRFSMASAQSSSTATSSSHQLVIDHQSEDIEPPLPPPLMQTFNPSNNFPLLPFKINLKRKLSQTSDTPAVSPPQHKMPHLDLQLEQSDATNEGSADVTYPILNGENMEQEEKTFVSEQSGNVGIEEVTQVNVFPETTKNTVPAEKSYQTSPARSSPLLNSLLLKKLPPPSDRFEKFPPPQKANKTKYLCFNCKSGSYKSLVALNEHQHICLADKALLPEITASTSSTTPIMPITRTQTPPVSPQQSLEKTISPIHNQQVPEIALEKRRYYQCSSCRTYHENWNLFLHIREIHKRHTCLYCIRMFPTAEKLSLHLEIKHDLEQNHFNSEEALRKSIDLVEGSANGARFLMCCTCQHVFLEHEHFSDHVCTEFMQACTLCGQKGRHTNQCKAQNEAKRSKVKKKSKVRDSTNAASLPHESSSSMQSNPPSVMPQPEYASNMPHMLTTNCDNVQTSSLLATFQPSATALPTLSFPQPQQHNEDSNSSCNMVIDETCNSTNYSRIEPYNPFKALDERERLEQQTYVAQPVLPPDRNQLTEQTAEKPEPMQPLIVPKFKLRVPKEFQKSVDAVISSTESEDDEELVIHEDDADGNITSNIKSTPSTTPQMDVENESITEPATEGATFQEAVEEHNKQPGVTAEDDDSLDEPNSNLVRILQEIERTKLDIMRTKETLHTSSKTSAAPRLATISQSSSRTGEHNWSPTPPASPNSQWYTPRRALSHGEGGVLSEMETKKEPSLPPLENMAPPPLPIQKERRRYTTGSEVDMDIDETISGQPVQCIERTAHRETAPNEKDEEVNISTESGVDKLSASTDGSFADIDVMNISNANMEDTNKTAPVDQEKEQSMNSEMPAQCEPVEQQALPMKEMQAEEPPTAPEIENSTKQEEPDIDVCSDKDDEEEEEEVKETQQLPPTPTPPPPADGIAVADEETIAVDLQLDRPLEKFQTIEFVRICLKAVYPLCLYCNHARRIAVNGKSLVLHLIAQHRFAATVDSITAEELKPGTIVAKLKSYLPELEEHYFNSNSYCTFGDGAFTHHFNERIFECFQCRFVTSTHKELYLHNRKMHLKTAILCFMCRANFFSFSEILCHVCPGESHKISVFDVKFRCCLCDVDNIPSPFRLMVHLRKKHFACDICLEDCRDQGRLSSHVWKHKLHHLCYRCGIAYRNKMDITKHLFWKHGTESIICKRCLQKRWRHVYHFCVPPVNFICDICTLCFSKATYLKVHKRIHTGDLRYPCTDENCEKKFISRRLLLKHTAEHQQAEINESQSMPGEKENSEQEQEIAAQVKDEQSIKIKEEVMEDVKELPMKNENNYEPQQSETKSESNVDKKSTLTEAAKPSTSTTTIGDTSCKQRKKRKSKRNKESLEDLNLTAPNLSESDSSDDSDVESKSKSGDDSLVPKVMLSPTSDTDNVKEENESAEKKERSSDPSGKVLDIWKNFLQSQGEEAIGDSSEPIRNATDYTEDYYPTPRKLHVAQSDHDYCVMFKPEPPKTLIEQVAPIQTSPHKRKTSKSPRRTSARRSEGSSGSSSGGSSGSSSDSSCSCGSNCSCSSSNSGSSSSSSSSNDSGDSSAASRTSRKRHRKKSERDRMRKKSESISPMKKHSMSESGGKGKLLADVDVGTETLPPPEPSEPMLPQEPLFYESDLETAESETDEEFYDEHPQKLATELLAQKRAQLMAQTRLSPSHNFDIVENSRPSTPSLPDDVARERKVRLKKKKRERKSTSRSMAAGTAVPPLKLNLGIASSQNVTKVAGQNQLLPDHQSTAAHQNVPLNTATNMGPSYELMRRSSFGIAEISSGTQQQFNTTTHTTAGLQLTPRPIGPQHHMGRMSEGSSCSDADASLKRSKRARRPNKFYGYTSDEEHNMSGLGQPLMIGMRAIKPQPPPQLTWCKEDLPTPSKSIINNNKIKMPRTPKTPNTPHNPQTPGGSLFNANLSGPLSTSLKKNRGMRGSDNAKIRKRNSKKSTMSSKLPPIPTLKIRSSQIGQTPTQQHMQVPTVGGGTNHIPASQIYSSSKESDEDDDDEEVDSTDSSSEDDGSQQMTPSTSGAKVAWNTTLLQANSATPTAPVAALILPQVAPAPPTPQAEAFNQKIPPALLPNPDFATLQYFKANNIRYPIRPPAGARQAREGESVYCYCRCPYDEVSEMIACDGENCLIEWFHFECVGIMVAPQGKWFCAECRPKYSEELYPTSGTA